MGCHEKFCYIRTCDVQKHYYGVVLHKLLYKQKYWLRRSRLLAVARRRTELHSMQKRMESESGVSLFNIHFMFNKAEHDIKAATAKTKRLHSVTVYMNVYNIYQQITHPLKQTWSPHLKGNVATQQQANHTSGNKAPKHFLPVCQFRLTAQGWHMFTNSFRLLI